MIGAANAKNYLVYPINKTQSIEIKKSYPQTKEVFTSIEKTFIESSQIKEALKLELDEDELKLFRINFKAIRLEENSQALPFNRYEKYQWSLDNKGESVQRWITDIDVRSIQGKVDEDIQIPLVQETSAKIRVAIIDSGVDLKHPDLIGQFYEDKKECAALKEYNSCLNTSNERNICHEKFSKIDNNNNGYPLDCNGWNITGKSNPRSQITGSANISDNNGHGTHIAGIIGAKNNDIGIKGIIQNVELLPVQVGLSSSSSTEEVATDNIAKGILYAIKNKAQVINLSLGWRINQDSLLMRQMIEQAINNDILVVAAAGNDSHDESVYPCSYIGVICVAAHDIDGKLSSFSNYGAHIDIAAPGNNILSSYPTNKRSKAFTQDPDYECLSGTSQAAPHVSAALARLLNLGFTPSIAKAKLLNGARKKNDSHKWIRFGNLDLKNAITANKNLIEVANKTAALINISKNKSFTFKIKTSLNTKVEIKSDELSFTKSSWNLKPNSEPQSLNSTILNDSINKKSYFITVKVNSKQFSKEYKLQLNPIMVISSKNKSKRLLKFKLEAIRNFNPTLIKSFENFSDDQNEYLAIKSINNRLMVQAVLATNNGYKTSRPVTLKGNRTLILSITKADVDLDGETNYIVARADLSDKNRKMLFDVFDEDFNPLDILISPRNEFKNDYTTMPGNFIWAKRNNKMVPTWISFGLDPDYTQSSPWDNREETKKMYRMYQLTSEGLIDLPINNEIYPISLLFQSDEDKLHNKLYFIAANGTGYKKSYSVYSMKDSKFEFLTHFNTKFYFNFIASNPLPLVNSNSSNAFFTLPTIDGAQRVVSVETNEKEIKLIQKEIRATNIYDPILRVLRFNSQGDSISQTPSNLIVQTNNYVETKTSYTDAKRIKHYLLEKTMGVILPENETFNLSSYTLIASDNGVIEPSYLQSFATEGCLEIGVENNSSKDFLSYYCEDNKEVLKLEVSK